MINEGWMFSDKISENDITLQTSCFVPLDTQQLKVFCLSEKREKRRRGLRNATVCHIKREKERKREGENIIDDECAYCTLD